MDAIASQITSLTIVYSTVYSDADERKHQSSASLAFVWGIHRGLKLSFSCKALFTQITFPISFLYLSHISVIRVFKPYLYATSITVCHMSVMVSQITDKSTVCWTVCSGQQQRIHQLCIQADEPLWGDPPLTDGFPQKLRRAFPYHNATGCPFYQHGFTLIPA